MVRVYPCKPPWPVPTFLFHLSAALVLGKGVQALQHLDRPALPEAAAQAGLGAALRSCAARPVPQPSVEPSRLHHLFMPCTFVTK